MTAIVVSFPQERVARAPETRAPTPCSAFEANVARLVEALKGDSRFLAMVDARRGRGDGVKEQPL